jgi:hypothetical protein
MGTTAMGGFTIQSRTSANALTPGGGGQLLLVAPVTVRTNLLGTTPTFAFLSLTYAPEPGTLLLLGLGLAGLAAMGRRAR